MTKLKWVWWKLKKMIRGKDLVHCLLGNCPSSFLGPAHPRHPPLTSPPTLPCGTLTHRHGEGWGLRRAKDRGEGNSFLLPSSLLLELQHLTSSPALDWIPPSALLGLSLQLSGCGNPQSSSSHELISHSQSLSRALYKLINTHFLFLWINVTNTGFNMMYLITHSCRLAFSNGCVWQPVHDIPENLARGTNKPVPAVGSTLLAMVLATQQFHYKKPLPDLEVQGGKCA